ncbi:MAG: glutamine-hydrolyzing GMP synthase, partial [Candidatus Curtissbacteria bacterium]|nr:glutamine-hydrolyzing GMP synthase [Candidatus Curtissbacteria bacterium]
MILVFNFGGQYAHLIARRVRDLGVKSELVAPDISANVIKKLKPQALIFSGSPFSCYDKNAPQVDKKIYDLQIPILGICYGFQLMAHQLDGKVSSHSTKQFGKETLNIKKSQLFSGLTSSQTVWFSHGDQVDRLPKGFEVIGSSKNAKIAAMENTSRKLYGIQFHPEVTHTQNGSRVLSNFLFKIAKATHDWNLTQLKAQIVKDLKKQIGDSIVLMAVSGGVDSTVTATLIKEAAPQNLHLVFIQTGLLRNYDIADLKDVAKKVKFKNFKIVNASNIFLKELKGVIDPEEKRKRIAKIYFKVLEKEAKRIGNSLSGDRRIKFLGQGTIYPDRIE